MIVYTTAPQDYDYGYMEEIGTHVATTGTEFRVLIAHDEWRCENFQIPRYRSGLYPAYTLNEFKSEGMY